MDNRDNVRTLLLLYKEHPCLYVVKSTDYYNRTKRGKAFQVICKKYEEITKRHLSVEIAKKKINNLRSQYLDYLNKIKSSKSDAMSTDDVYKPTWWLFKEIKFLDPHIGQRKGESNIIMSNNQSESSECNTTTVDDPENLQFSDVNILRAENYDKENADLESPVASYSNSTTSCNITTQCKKRKFEMESESKNDEVKDGLKYWTLYLESELRKIKDPKKLKRLQKEIIALVDDGNVE